MLIAIVLGGVVIGSFVLGVVFADKVKDLAKALVQKIKDLL